MISLSLSLSYQIWMKPFKSPLTPCLKQRWERRPSHEVLNARKVNCGRVYSTNHLVWIILKIHIIVSYEWPEYFINYFCGNWFHVRLWHPSCVYYTAQRQYTIVQKTSEITFLALAPCPSLYLPKGRFDCFVQTQLESSVRKL